MKKKSKSQRDRKRAHRNRVVEHRHRILVAEDDKEMRVLLAHKLRKKGYEILECPDGWELLKHVDPFRPRIEREDFDLIISDVRMPGITGLEILEDLSEIEDFPPMILITGFGDEKVHADAKRFGAAAMYDKPFDIDDLLEEVCKIAPLSDPFCR